MSTQTQPDDAGLADTARKAKLPIRAIVAVGCLVLFAWLVLQEGQAFLFRFPYKFAWTEMLLNYQGGFIKRGLLGEIAFQLNDFFPAQNFIAVLTVALYLLVAIWLVNLAAARLGLASLLFLFSPAGILFPVQNPGAFGRKDIFIVAAFGVACWIVSKVKAANLALGLIMLTYFVAALTVETALFYFPLAAMLVALSQPQPLRWQLGAGIVATLFLLFTVQLATIYPSPPPEPAILKSWLLYADVPPAFAAWGQSPRGPGQLCCLDMNLTQATAFSSIWNPAVRYSYLLAFFLASLPLMLLLRDWRPPTLDALTIAGTVLAFVAMTGPYILAADAGRYIHLFVVQGFAFLCVTGVKPLGREVSLAELGWAKLGLVAVYATAWTLPYFSRTRGIAPGPLLRFLGFS
jgi:hypothetical protein